MDTLSTLLILGAMLVLGVILFKILAGPMKLITKILLNTAIGYVVLFVFDFFAEFFDISVGLNLFNAVLVGLLGIPGIILLVILKVLF